jgi:hypothetical protein
MFTRFPTQFVTEHRPNSNRKSETRISRNSHKTQLRLQV